MKWPEVDSVISVLPMRKLPGPDSNQSWAILSGIACAKGFETGCLSLVTQRPLLAVRCNDHCSYSPRLLARILDSGKEKGITAWLTTAKDYVKLQSLWPQDIPLVPVELAIKWAQEKTLDDLIVERLQTG